MGSCPLPWHSDSLVSLFSYTEVSGDGVGGEVCGEQERGLGGASGGQDRASCPMALALCRTPKDRQIPGGYGGLQGPSLISAWARGLREVLRPGSVGVRANLDVQVGGFPVGGGGFPVPPAPAGGCAWCSTWQRSRRPPAPCERVRGED